MRNSVSEDERGERRRVGAVVVMPRWDGLAE